MWRNDTLTSVYTYDPNGNRISHWTPTKVDSGAYDAQDRMLKYSSISYLYTANGELRYKIEGIDTTKYIYDYFGNLLSIKLPNGDLIEYLIDGQNRRIGKKINGTVEKRWIYSSQLSPIAELDSEGNVVSQFVGGFMIKNGNTYQLITDHLGSVRLVVDVNTGDIAEKIDYDEFGNVLSNTNPNFQPFAYAGGLYDTQTKLVRFGARDYDATIGRWTSKDPIRFGGGINVYVYCGNNPINMKDKLGLACPPKDGPDDKNKEKSILDKINDLKNAWNAWNLWNALSETPYSSGLGPLISAEFYAATMAKYERDYANGTISSDERYAREVVATVAYGAGAASPLIGVPLGYLGNKGIDFVNWLSAGLVQFNNSALNNFLEAGGN